MLVNALKSERNLGDQRISIQMSKLLVRPWQRSSHFREGLRPLIVVIDALDENEAGAEFIKLVLKASRSGRLKGLRILLTSRPEPEIKHLCADIDGRAVCNLNEVSRDIVGNDILHFLSEELPEHRDTSYLMELARVSDGLFIYASTAVRLVRSKGRHRTIKEQETKILQITKRTLTHKKSPGGILDGLYAEIIEDAFYELDEDERDLRERVLLTIVCTTASLDLSIIGSMAEVDTDIVQSLVEALYAVLYIDASGNVRWHHASFQDYVLIAYPDILRSTRLRTFCWCWKTLTWSRPGQKILPSASPLLINDDLKEIFGVEFNGIPSLDLGQRLIDQIIDLVQHAESREAEVKRLDAIRAESWFEEDSDKRAKERQRQEEAIIRREREEKPDHRRRAVNHALPEKVKRVRRRPESPAERMSSTALIKT